MVVTPAVVIGSAVVVGSPVLVPGRLLSDDHATSSAVKLKYIHTPSSGAAPSMSVKPGVGWHEPPPARLDHRAKGPSLSAPIGIMATLVGTKPNSTPETSRCGGGSSA